MTSELQTVEGSASVNGNYSQSVPSHKVTVHDKRGLIHEFVVPEDQYILLTAESQDISLPFVCRHGGCTRCAVCIKSGQIRQPEALGISAELKSKAIGMHFFVWVFHHLILKLKLKMRMRMRYIGFNLEDIWKIFCTLKNLKLLFIGPKNVVKKRDDYALELAMGDEYGVSNIVH